MGQTRIPKNHFIEYREKIYVYTKDEFSKCYTYIYTDIMHLTESHIYLTGGERFYLLDRLPSKAVVYNIKFVEKIDDRVFCIDVGYHL